MTETKRLNIPYRDFLPFLTYAFQLTNPKPAANGEPKTDIKTVEDGGLELKVFGGREVNLSVKKGENGLYIEDADRWEGHTDEQWQDLRAFLGQDTTDPATFVFTDDMSPISNKGPEFEETCRKLVVAGAHWRRDNPGKKVDFAFGKVLMGPASMDLTIPINDAAVELDAVLSEVASVDDKTYEAVLRHIDFIANYGWKVYCMSRREKAVNKPAELVVAIEV